MDFSAELYCNATFDQFLCWGYTKAGTSVTQNCPPDVPFVDPSSFETLSIFSEINRNLADQALRHCGFDGRWLDQHNQSSLVGWTDFIKCFPPYMQDILENVAKSTDGFTSKYAVAVWVRGVEFFGLSTSAISLVIAITVFTRYPKLLNSRTRIHRHLFSVLLTQAMTTLFIYTDQEALQILPRHNVACIIVYSCYELLTSMSFAFMLIEGFTLYRIVSAKALQPQISHRIIVASGYVLPCINTLIWFSMASYSYGWKNGCWFGYNLDNIFFMLQAPRLFIVLTNLIFMLLVVHMVLKKTQNDNTELQRIKKAVRATIFLTPLLGITNYMSMTNAPLRTTTITFALWAFFAYFLRSLQGFFVSYIYCFRNNEVLDVVCRRTSKNEVEDRPVRFPANTECETLRKDDDAKLDLPEEEDEQSLDAEEMNKLSTDAADDIEGGQESIEMTEVIVHRCDDPSDDDQ